MSLRITLFAFHTFSMEGSRKEKKIETGHREQRSSFRRNKKRTSDLFEMHYCVNSPGKNVHFQVSIHGVYIHFRRSNRPPLFWNILIAEYRDRGLPLDFECLRKPFPIFLSRHFVPCSESLAFRRHSVGRKDRGCKMPVEGEDVKDMKFQILNYSLYIFTFSRYITNSRLAW